MGRAWVSIVALSLVLGTWSCAAQQQLPGAPSAPGRWGIHAPGLEVRLSESPYALTVLDEQGRELLSTAALGDQRGFSALAWTTGEVKYRTRLSPGYTHVSTHLEPYREQFEVQQARVTRDSAVLLLAPLQGEGPLVEVQHQVSAGVLRVSARLQSAAPRAWSVGFVAQEQEGFLGFGERFNRVNQRGNRVFNWAEEGGVGLGERYAKGAANPWPNGELMTYYPVPFFVSTRGYGFWLDTTYYSEFDLQEVGAERWRASHVGPTLAYEVYVPSARDARPWPHQVVDLFTARTGRPMLPPAWAFGPRRRISPSSTEREVPEAQAMRDADLALTAIDDAMHFFPSGAHRGREAALRAWTSEAAQLGLRVNGYYNSFVTRGLSGPFSELTQRPDPRELFLHRADGSLPSLWIVTGGRLVHTDLLDFTHPEARAWYAGSFNWALDLGYSGWMYDFGEYVPADVVAFDGTSGEALHNQYPVQYAQLLHQSLEASAKAGDWLAFMRSGYTGSSAFVPMVWAGDPAGSFEDADGLPSMVRAGLTLGISGAPFWGGDIGGYHCVADGSHAADTELLVRWIQQGALSPNMQDQNACVGPDRKHKATLWNSTTAQDAWRHYARLHTRLFPYLYTWAQTAQRAGTPLMRPLFFEHPERPDLADVDDAYYLGPALLVAPVVKRGARSKDVELPAGEYLDWDSRALLGAGRQRLAAPLNKLPLLLRAGHLVPLLDASIDTLTPETNPDVVGPTDVAQVYDVVALLSAKSQSATLTLYDGSVLQAQLLPRAPEPSVARPPHVAKSSASQSGVAGLRRVQIEGQGNLRVGRLHLQSTSPRVIRWDVSLAGLDY